MKKEISDISTGIVLLLFSIIGYTMAVDLESRNTAMNYGPDFFPKLVLTLLAITSIILFANAIRKFKKSTERIEVNKKVVITVLTFILIIIGYVTLFFFTGFIVSTIVFLLIGQWAFGMRNIFVISMTSIVLPIALYFLFVFFFKVPLP